MKKKSTLYILILVVALAGSSQKALAAEFDLSSPGNAGTDTETFQSLLFLDARTASLEQAEEAGISILFEKKSLEKIQNYLEQKKQESTQRYLLSYLNWSRKNPEYWAARCA